LPFCFLTLDLDGTLLRTDKSISDRTRRAIELSVSSGLTLIVVTARPPRSAEHLLDGYLADALCVYYSGVFVRLGEKFIHKQTIPVVDASQIVNGFLDRVSEARISVKIDDRLFSTHPHVWVKPEDIRDVRPSLVREPVKIMLHVTHCDLPDSVRCILSDKGALAQICHRNVSESDGLMRLLDRLGGTLADVIAFDDDTNDAEMIR
tara:strand:+ start:8067 stop:8684 length:618 start_codon:yes stop_codon:yes gene_type:complete